MDKRNKQYLRLDIVIARTLLYMKNKNTTLKKSLSNRNSGTNSVVSKPHYS